MIFNPKELGLNVIPCYPRDKKPAINWKPYQDAIYTEEIKPEMNRAVICGKTSGGLVVIDIDAPELIDKIFTDFNSVKSKTLVVRTGSGGYHIYVRPKEGIQHTMRLDNTIGQHLDIQSDGTYVVAPESTHPNGKRYEIISTTTNIESMDIQGFVSSLSAYGFNPQAGAQLPPISELIKSVPVGSRNSAAYKYAAHLIGTVGLDGASTLREVKRWAEELKFTPREGELESVVKSALKRVKPPVEEPTPISEVKKKIDWTNFKKIREIKAEIDEGNEISFDSFIAAVAEPRTVITLMLAQCPTCSNTIEIPGEGYVNPKLPKCSKCKVTLTIKSIKKTTDMREVLLQEPSDESQTQTPVKFTSRFIGNHAHGIEIGKKIRVTGKYRSFSEPGHKDNEVAVLISRIESLDEPEDVFPTQNELSIIKSEIDRVILEGKDPIKTLFIPSYAPDLFGLEVAKEVMLLTIAAAFKSPSMRGDINTILIGNPSKGKTQLLMFAEEVTTNSGFANASTSSPAGLVYGMVKMANGTSVAEAGLLVLKSGGFGIIDELDKTTVAVHNAILQVMEEQQVPFHKSGVNLIAKAETAVIAACNPKDGKWDSSVGPMENINLPQPLVSRFDWIVGIIKTNQVLRGMVADQIFNKMNGECKAFLNKNELKHYLSYVRTLKPILTQNTFDILKDFYMKTVEKMYEEGLPFEERQLEGLMRSTVARAKLLMKKKTEASDALAIIELYKKSLESLGLKIEGDTIQSVFEDDKIGKDRAFRKAWHELEGDDGLVDKTEFFKKLIEKYPKHFADIYECDKYFSRYEGTRMLLQPDGKYKMRL